MTGNTLYPIPMIKALLLSIALFIVSCSVKANTYYVTTVSDTGAGSLRAMIDSANSNPGLDTVLLSLGVHDIINLGSSLPKITDSIVITGQQCQNPIVDGDSIAFNHAAFYCTNNAIPVTINYLNIFNCKNTGSGGAAAVSAAGQLYLNYCLFYGNTNSTSGPAGGGGAVFGGYVQAYNSTFVSNSQLVSSAGGGALYSNSGNIYNCTFTGNSSAHNGGALNGTFNEVINCTITANYAADSGGGIFNSGNNPAFNISNSIIWGNAIGLSALQASIGGISFASNVNSGGCNILQDTPGSNFFTLTGTDVHGVDPQLGNFGYYSGCVPVVPILCGSVAQNHASCAGATTTDAEGIPAQGIRDAGAFELTYPVLGGDTIDSIQPGTTASLFNYFNVTGDSVIWPAGLNDSSAASVDTGTYTVIAINQFGCSDTVIARVLYATDTTDTLGTGLKGVLIFNSFKLYPNPAKDATLLSWSGNSSGMFTLKVSDMLGRVVMQENLNESTGRYSINTGNLVSGVYAVTVHQGRENIFSGKLIVLSR